MKNPKLGKNYGAVVRFYYSKKVCDKLTSFSLSLSLPHFTSHTTQNHMLLVNQNTYIYHKEFRVNQPLRKYEFVLPSEANVFHSLDNLIN